MVGKTSGSSVKSQEEDGEGESRGEREDVTLTPAITTLTRGVANGAVGVANGAVGVANGAVCVANGAVCVASGVWSKSATLFIEVCLP